MKLIKKPFVEYIGWYVQCQCGAISEVESERDLKTHEPGDFKDEGSLKWKCVHCMRDNYGSYSRLKHDSGVLKKSLMGGR